MKVELVYCHAWNYEPQAVSLTQDLLELYGDFIENMTLVPSDGGVFEVSVDGELIFSKKREGRFPTNDEILKVVKAKT